MGIPSYYKKLLNELPSLIKRSHPDATIEWLFLDFNCLMYHCLPRAPAYSKENHDSWEASFIECIVQYCLKVVRQVNPKMGVYLAIDGVVPMAKMRQQRLRRFKSVWLKANGNGNTESWDTNAITPGTVFMQRLHAGLEKMMKGRARWVLSSSNEPGEGEHKIMNAWRTGQYQGNVAVYGLDADLIVLSLLGRRHVNGQAWLFREEVENGVLAHDADGEELFEWFSIDTLEAWITQGAPDGFLLDYACAMSVLGNDFLPSSLGLKMRDHGHTELLRILRALPLPLVYPRTMELSLEGLQGLFRLLAAEEPARIERALYKKQKNAHHATETGLGEGNWPMSQKEEEVLVFRRGPDVHLDRNWQKKYHDHFFAGHEKADIVDSYLYGIQWIWAYYTGRTHEICFNWYYPFSLPPLWEWVREVVALPDFPSTVVLHAHDIKPVQQLALVLPLESWHLIPPCPERRFPYIAPQFFPQSFTFESVGKRYFWECEAQIPLPSMAELQARVSNSSLTS